MEVDQPNETTTVVTYASAAASASATKDLAQQDKKKGVDYPNLALIYASKDGTDRLPMDEEL